MDFIPKTFNLFSSIGKKVHLVSLGCPKNRVDAELMLGQIQKAGYGLTMNPDEADLLIVNTCAFIESAKVESIDTILTLAEHKDTGSAERLIVTGCLAQRYGNELTSAFPEVDFFLGTNDFNRITHALDGSLPKRAYISAGAALYTSSDARINSIRGGSAYVKIAEGCSRTCAFCVIPKIRGKQVSRIHNDIVREVQMLAISGIKEIALIAQDLTSYGKDLGIKNGLEKLLVSLSKIDGIAWIRLHYTYPWGFTDRLLELIAEQPRILPYIDMPLQHISDHLLKKMQRATRRKTQEKIIERLRKIDNMVLRTAFISGFPGETDADHQALLNWIQQVRFDHVGVFEFSREEDTLAFDMINQVPAELAKARRDELMQTQALIAFEKNQTRIGQHLDIIVDGISQEHQLVLEGRHYGQAIGIDGVTFLSFEDGAPPALPGEIVRVEIDDAIEYDLVGIVQK